MVVIVLNSFAGGGQAKKRWESIKSKMPTPFVLINLQEVNTTLHEYLLKEFHAGQRIFVAAGGDGTVNLLAQTLLETFCESDLNEITLGAIGLGSSNDFHKPIHNCVKINGYPCRLSVTQKQRRDILKLTLDGDDYSKKQRFALLNVSCGITANANRDFNKPNIILRFFKRYSVNLAIFIAAIKSIFTFKNQEMRIISERGQFEHPITNIGIIKSPFFSGNFAYDTNFIPDNGVYSVYICHNMNILEAVRTLFKLRRHCFIQGKKAFRLQFNKNSVVEISSKRSFSLEFDGEVESIYSVKISLMKSFINCCT